MMKKIILTLAASAFLFSCNCEKKNGETCDSKQTCEQKCDKTDASKCDKECTLVGKTFTSNDATRQYQVMATDAEAGTIKIKDLKNDQEIDAQITEAASGEKYVDASGNYYWFAKDELTIGNSNDEATVTCKTEGQCDKACEEKCNNACEKKCDDACDKQ